MIIAWVLVIIGAINWGLVGIGNFVDGNWDLVELILGSIEWLRDIVYILVGISGILVIFGGKCKACETEAPAQPAQDMGQQM